MGNYVEFENMRTNEHEIFYSLKGVSHISPLKLGILRIEKEMIISYY